MIKKIQLTAVLFASLVAGAAMAQEATEVPNSYGTGTLTRAEVKADLEVWNRSGMGQLSRGESTPKVFSQRYRQAYSEYVRMRNGPEYQEALKKQKSK